MRKFSLLMVSMSLVLGSTMAVVGGPEAPEDGVAITSSSSATTSVSENGTEWKSSLDNLGGSCLVGDQEIGLNVTDVYRENGMTVSKFSGTLETNNPCVSLESSIEETGDGQFTLVLEELSGNGTCAQCIGSRQIEGSFRDEGDYELEIVYRNDTVATVDTSEKLDEQKQGFFRWLFSLLGF